MDRRDFLKLAAVGAVAAAAPTGRTEPGQTALSGGAFDLVVVGGSATGVFAAVRAAEAGLRVALIENNAVFGGTATAGFVPIWHSMFSTKGERIVRGLTAKAVDQGSLLVDDFA